MAGWGLTKSGGPLVHQLRVVDVSVISPEVCRENWPGLPDGLICAGGYGTNKGFCQVCFFFLFVWFLRLTANSCVLETVYKKCFLLNNPQRVILVALWSVMVQLLELFLSTNGADVTTRMHPMFMWISQNTLTGSTRFSRKSIVKSYINLCFDTLLL